MAATEAPATPPVEEIIERERSGAPRAGLAALLAAIMAVIGGVVPQAIYSDSPRVYLLDAIKDSAGQSIGRTGLKTAEILFLNDKAGPLLLLAVVQAVGTLATGYMLLFLLGAAMDRGARIPAIARMLVLFGAVATAVANIGLQVAVMIRAHVFAGSADHSTKAAHDVLRSPVVVAASGVGTFGALAFAGGFVLVAIAAMRVGLLTRFLGILGAIVGVLVVLGPATGSSSFIVSALWLAMIGALLLGRWPTGVPAAWSQGVAVPWPSQQEIREQREAARSGRRPAARPAAAAAGDAPDSEAPSPATSRKKKRKRRT